MVEIMANAMCEIDGDHGLKLFDDANISWLHTMALAEAALDALMANTGLRIVPLQGEVEAGVWRDEIAKPVMIVGDEVYVISDRAVGRTTSTPSEALSGPLTPGTPKASD